MTRLNCRRRCPCAFTYVDLVVILCVLPVVAVGCWHSGCRSRETANRVKCASNLRQIGQALTLYQNDNDGTYPRTRASVGDSPVPTWGTGAASHDPFSETGPAPNDVSAALFLLLRTQDITAEVFTCPSTNAEKDIFDGKNPIERSNFTDIKKNLSYSFQNVYPSPACSAASIDKGATQSLATEEIAIAADLSPGTTSTGCNVLAPSTSSSAKDMRQANSPDHDADGQNILYMDGHVAWESSPFVGVKRDNIYTTRDGKVIASPVDYYDSILLPTND